MLANRQLMLLSFVLLGVFQPVAGQDRKKTEAERNIRLPKTDGHYKQTANYIEDVPDADYRHASEEAYEAFRDMKFSVRIHWGLYSMKELNEESWPFLKVSNADKQAYLESYKDFNPVSFNATQWMDLFKRAGLQGFAFITKHHDGFSLFDTKTIVQERVNYLAPGGPAIEKCSLSYDIMETPFKRDIVKELVEAGRKADLKVNLYYSHPDWYDADFRPYSFHPLQTEHIKNNPGEYSSNDIFKSNVNKIMTPEPTPLQKQRMIDRHRTQLKELLTNYGPIDMICLDQYLGKPVWPEIKQTIKELRKIHPDVMFRARGIGNYGDYYTPEGFVPDNKENTNMPWMVIYPLATSFSYDKDATKYKGTKWIIDNLVDAVAKGGSFMVGVGPDAKGLFHPKAVEQLEGAGKWLAVNGKAIYNTRSGAVWKEGAHVRFTISKDHKYIYATTLLWPGEKFVLKSVQPEKGSKIYMLGHAAPLQWEYKNKQLIIQLPKALEKINQYAWSFSIQGKQTVLPSADENLIANPDFSLGNVGGIPSGWATEAPREGLMPVFRRAAGSGLVIKASGNKDNNGSVVSEVPVEGGKTYLYEVRFKVSPGFNPQQSLLFQCYGPYNKDGIFTYTKADNNEITGSVKITIPKNGKQKAKIRIIFRNSANGEVIVKNISLKETTPVPERWARVAVMQGKPTLNVIPDIVAKAAEDSADLILLPEFMNGGKMIHESMDGPSASLMAALAAKHKMYVAGGIVRKSSTDDRLYNTTLLYDRNGKLAASYDKIHLYSPEVNEEGLTPGDKVVVFDADFGRIGFMTCYDSWFTDVAELNALKGAELILFPNAGYYRSLIPARAADNSVRIITSSLHNGVGIWDTGGRDVQSPGNDPTSNMQAGATYKNVKEMKVGNIKMLVASLDMNFSPLPHYNGGTMYSAPGGRRNRAEQIYYLEEDIRKEKERWWKK